MTENEFKKTLIDLISTDDYPEKNILLELLRISTIKFNKTSQYSKKEWNHCEEFIYVCIIPSKMKELDLCAPLWRNLLIFEAKKQQQKNTPTCRRITKFDYCLYKI